MEPIKALGLVVLIVGPLVTALFFMVMMPMWLVPGETGEVIATAMPLCFLLLLVGTLWATSKIAPVVRKVKTTFQRVGS